MKTLTKILSFGMMMALLFCSLVGCSSANRIKSTKEQSRVVGTCAGYDVRYEELRYLALTHAAEMKQEYGEGIFESADADSYEDELEARVARSLCETYAILDICEKAGVKRSAKQTKNEVNEDIDATVAALGGMEAYEAYLAEAGMTDAVNRLYTAIVSCQYRYYDEVAFDELEKEAYDAVLAGEVFVRVKNIFVRNDAGEDVEKNRADAEYVRAEIIGGKPLESFIGSKYNQDLSDCDYYFPRGYMEDSYEQIAFSLEIGEVGEVLQTDEGFYVIQRYAPEDGFFQNNLETLIDQYIVGKMNLSFEAHAETLSFDKNEYGMSLVLSDIR